MRAALPVGSALAAAISLAVAATAWAQPAEQPPPTIDKGEKCYGIARAGKNDCKATSHACAGWAATDADPVSFVLLPAGTCEKIAGASLMPKA